MKRTEPTLVCWYSERAGFEVLERALDALRNRRVRIAQVLYLVQEGRAPEVPRAMHSPAIDILELPVEDPTRHTEVYAAVRGRVLPHLHGRGPVHVNLSPGTPAMHAVWLVLHAGGAFPPDTRLWSSQYNPATRRTRIDPVEFPVTPRDLGIRRRGAGLRREDAPPGCLAGEGSRAVNTGRLSLRRLDE